MRDNWSFANSVYFDYIEKQMVAKVFFFTDFKSLQAVQNIKFSALNSPVRYFWKICRPPGLAISRSKPVVGADQLSTSLSVTSSVQAEWRDLPELRLENRPKNGIFFFFFFEFLSSLSEGLSEMAMVSEILRVFFSPWDWLDESSSETMFRPSSC